MSFFSRRSLLKLLASVPVAATGAGNIYTKHQRPRRGLLNYDLLFDESDVERIRAHFNLDLFSDLRDQLQGLDYDAEYAYYENEIRYNDQLSAILRLGRNIEEQSFLYLMTGEARVRDFVVESVDQLMKFERWDFFLDGDRSIGVQRAPQSTVAVSLACDWLGDSLDPEKRRGWIKTMGERGVTACYASSYLIANPSEVEEWRFDPESTIVERNPNNQTDQNRRAEITQNTNLRAIPGSALVIGSIAYQIEFGASATTREWIRMGLFTVEAFRDFFMPDGSYNEEVQYANYTALHILQSAIVARRHGISALDNIVPWNNHVEFLLNMTMPTNRDPHQVVNFGDSGNRPNSGRHRTAISMWIAGSQRNGLAQWYALNRGGLHNPWSVIWYDPAVEPVPPQDGPTLWISDLDRVVARNGWDAEDTVVGLRSGPPANHEHGDRNSIVVAALGQKLITDPMRPPYNYSDPAWSMRLTQGHSAILVDDKGHEHHNGIEGTNASNSFARIKESSENRDFSWWRSVATQPYRLVDVDIKNVIRSVAFLYDANVIVISDFVDKYKSASTVTARFFGDNLDGQYRSKIGDSRFTVYRPGAVLRADVFSNTSFNITQGTPFVPGEYGEQHPFIDIKTQPATDTLIVIVLSIASTESELAATSIAPSPDGFSVDVDGRTVIATRQTIDVV